jgi:hypothetical protein
MKNSEEDILKRFLQDTFSDYEPEPIDQTWENIRKEIQPQQPNVGAGLRPWIVPVVALLLLIGSIVWNGKYELNKTELAINSTKENSSSENYTQWDGSRPSKGRLPFVNKTSVNKATSKVESRVIPKVEKSIGLPNLSTILTEPIAKQNVQEYSVSTKEFVGIDDKSAVLPTTTTVDKISKTNTIKRNDVGDGFNAVRENNEISSAEVNVSTDHSLTNSNVAYSDKVTQINEAIIEEVRYIKPLETLKNKDFVLVKNEISLPKITSLLINKDPKPLRRPTYMSVSITPIQTYRIFTVNHLGVQNLQTNKLFDSERNGWAFELGITKPIGDKWNFRGGVSYLKMKQRAEYQVNTNIISVKNSNNYSNAAVVVGNGTEFIGQTQIEQKTLQMVGLKGDIQKFFNVSGRNRYFISGGSQLMYEPSEKQTNIFINASAGFQHIVNKDLFLTIEPTASYILNNINDSKSLIQTNAYNLGLKVGVNFKVK